MGRPVQREFREGRRRTRRPAHHGLWVVALGLAAIVTLLLPAAAGADPGPLSVSKAASSQPLLGGTATYTITVANPAAPATKGYNLSIVDEFASSPSPGGTSRMVTFVSATDRDGDVIPTSVATNPTTGRTTLSFINIRDLAPNETYRLTITVSLAGDPAWQAGDFLHNSVTASVAPQPDGSGTPVTAAAVAPPAKVLPIKLVTKSVLQSTGVEQATGTETHPYRYRLTVQNNYLNTTDDVVVTDTLPDGVEYLGITSGPGLDAGFPVRDPATGVTTLQWTLGSMTAGTTTEMVYETGIRYDYFGTDNGGTNRPTASLVWPLGLGVPIPDKATLTNTAGLTAEYMGQPVTDEAEASVTAAYLTIAKSGTPATGGNGTVISYSLTYTASQYYDITAGTVVLTDTLPAAVDYVPGSASVAPDSPTVNPDGTLTLSWPGASLGGLSHGSSATITFQGVVRDTYRAGSPYAGQPVVAGDAAANRCDVSGDWVDLLDPGRIGDSSSSTATAGFSTHVPAVTKAVRDPVSGLWTSTANATVGDTVSFLVRFNTTDSLTPTLDDIRMGSVTLTDWLPPGMSFVARSIALSDLGHFTQPAGTPPPLINPVEPALTTSGGLNGLDWFVGDVAAGGWWEAEITARVNDVPAVQDGVTVNNLWKLTGIATDGTAYSNRAAAAVTYKLPRLTIGKTAAAASPADSPLRPGSWVRYTLTVTNTGTAPARDVSVTDVLADGMRAATPVVESVTLGGSGLTEGTDYRLSPAYNAVTGTLTVDLEDAPVRTPIPAGSSVVITYRARIDATATLGKQLINQAEVDYNTQHDGSGRPGAANTSATVTIAAPTGTKTSTAASVIIGDTVLQTLQFTVPANEIAYWPQIEDTVQIYGVAFDPSFTPVLEDVSGAPAIAASLAAGATPAVTHPTTTSTRFTWLLSRYIDNRGSATDYVFKLTFRLRCTAVSSTGSWLFFPPNASDVFNDTGRLRWSTADSATRPAAPSVNASTNSVSTGVLQPVLALTKSVTTAGPYVGGSTVGYRTVITNTGLSAAHDMVWRDALPATLHGAALTSVTLAGSPLVEGVGYSKDFSSNALVIDFSGGITASSLPVNQSIVIDYTAIVDANIGAGTAITNNARVNWSSLPGSATGERDYSEANLTAVGYTAHRDSETITTTGATIDKTVTPAQATIGGVFTYRVRLTVPAESEAFTPSLVDSIATDGLRYVPGSAAVSHVSGDPVTPAVLVPTVTESYSPLPAQLGFSFASPIDNADPAAGKGDTPYVFDLTFQMRVTGMTTGGTAAWPDQTRVYPSADTATFHWNDGAVDHTSSEGAGVDVVQPHVVIAKSATPATVEAGDTVSYELTLTNDGNSPAHSLIVTDNVPDQLFVAGSSPAITSVTQDILTLTPGVDYQVDTSADPITITFAAARTLARGSIIRIRYTAPVPAGIAGGLSLTNTATCSYTSADAGTTGLATYLTPEADDTVTTIAPALQGGKSIVGPASVSHGDIVHYRYVLVNTGTATARDIEVVDVLPATTFSYVAGSTAASWPGASSTADPSVSPSGTTLTWDLDADLTPGDGLILEYSVLVGRPLPGQYANTIEASGKDGGGAGVDALPDTATVDIVRPPGSFPEVAVTKSLAPGQAADVPVGATVAYRIVVENTGATILTQIPLAETYDASRLTYLSASVAPTSASAGSLSWADLAPSAGLAPGASVTIDLAFRAIAPGATIPDTATVSGALDEYGDTAPDDSDDAVVSIHEVGAFTLTKTLAAGQADPVAVGDEIRYTITIASNGRAALTHLPLTDTYDATRLEFVSAEPAPSVVTPGRLSWADLAPPAGLKPGSEVSVTVVMKGIAPAEDVLNTATVSGALDEHGDVLPDAEVTAPVDVRRLGKLRVLKTGADVNGGSLIPGDDIRWQIRVKNTGGMPLTQVVVKDTVPKWTTYVRKSIRGPGANDRRSPKLSWTIGTLDPGETVTVGFKSRVDYDAPRGVRIRNQATVTSAELPPTPSTDPESGVLGAVTALTLTSGDGPAAYWSALALGLGGLAMIVWSGRWRRRPTPGPEGPSEEERA